MLVKSIKYIKNIGSVYNVKNVTKMSFFNTQLINNQQNISYILHNKYSTDKYNRSLDINNVKMFKQAKSDSKSIKKFKKVPKIKRTTLKIKNKSPEIPVSEKSVSLIDKVYISTGNICSKSIGVIPKIFIICMVWLIIGYVVYYTLFAIYLIIVENVLE